ncbi:sporulation protein [Thermaerobacillus caldiproteolyticus]|uniref:Sporulation-control protein n=1 Tax=Thermaerobacillus caldiproteolyticus TaxID=247480 RepID=A0A7W0BYX0_9BACL|nr:sporulation protein [Anoxybacillus caldiproteolyticus]MBA2875408.1 sporulation-control protein [Anoxybacillus caldiproteolyticus]QPA32700.1 sporulation protein [Anoxybacillus caldiproteolyticus]
MSLFHKLLARVGIGAAIVDTKLLSERLMIGDEVEGIVEITGGNTEQAIDHIYLSLYATYTVEVDDRKTTSHALIGKWKITEPFTIGIHEQKKIPFRFTLPLDTPITVGKTKVWLHTGLDMKYALDPNDQDYIRVEPTPVMNAVLASMEDMGFRLREAECKKAVSAKRLPFVQEFEYVPKTGLFRERLDEVEIMFASISKDEVIVYMQIDRRARGLKSLFAEALDLDESYVHLRVTSDDLSQLSQKLSRFIQSYC